jgi:hypothetical protein
MVCEQLCLKEGDQVNFKFGFHIGNKSVI